MASPPLAVETFTATRADGWTGVGVYLAASGVRWVAGVGIARALAAELLARADEVDALRARPCQLDAYGVCATHSGYREPIYCQPAVHDRDDPPKARHREKGNRP